MAHQRRRPVLRDARALTLGDEPLAGRVEHQTGPLQPETTPIRHRCHNRRCINPEHLETGSRADNLRDEWDRRANGINWRWV
ncbi:HNH endonuclease [Shimia abyssi]|uniref:HNH endonuclease n=1 Tax=Shimia abyssi TaxID=1662395 RepID=UPI000D0D4BF5